MKRYANPRETLVYVTIAVLLMIAIFLAFDGRGFLPNFKNTEQAAPVAPVQLPDDSPVADEGFEGLPQPEPVRNAEPEEHGALEPHDHPLWQEFNNEPPEITTAKAPEPKPAPVARYALKNPNPGKARIAIMIDDMGMSRARSKQIVNIDSVPLTLAFLPYADNLESLTGPAKANGHALMIHMPMEPVSSKVDTGPIALLDGMNRAEVDAMMEQAYASFDGYDGINNHMGSRVTQNPQIMQWVMDSLAKRGLYYVDSRTIATSVAADAAQARGIDYAVRDVFLDHEDHIGFVRNALAKTERVALEKGHAIAIGHPKTATIAGLKEWIPTLEARGFEVVPVSELLKTPVPQPEVITYRTPKKPKPSDDFPFVEPASGEPVNGLYRFSD